MTILVHLKIITDDMLSDYARKLKDSHEVTSGKVSKLVTTLLDKEKYVLHYRNLKLYLELRLRVKKIHRVFFKLMNNSVFGKTMENLRNRVNIELVTNEKRLNKLSAKPTYVSNKIFNENLVAVHTKKERLLLDKPSYVGMCILDLVKLICMIFIIIISEKNTLIAGYFLLILIHFFTRSKVRKIFTKSSW